MKYATLALTLLWAATALAIPLSINYQGKISAEGAPFTGSGEFRFALVDETGTTSYWSNDGTSTGGSEPVTAVVIDVNNGLYHVILGGVGMDAIPAAAFDNEPMYLRIWFDDGINGSQQLAPDQEMTSVGFAFKSGDADTVDGFEGSDLEESAEIDADIAAHAALPDAHHVKTTLFSELTDTAADAQIPDDITVNYSAAAGNADTVDGLEGSDLEESAEIDADIVAHAALPDAHHAKTTLFSELTDTATDEQIPDDITVNYATAAGDADTVDGMHADAFYRQDGNAFGEEGWLGTNDAFALNLEVNNTRALRVESGTSPNLIGGYSGNWLAAGVFGAVIGGGGQSGNLNRVVDHVGVVGGGQNNQAGSDDGNVGNNNVATVGGGANNTAAGTVSTIGGGSGNTANGYISAIAGGRSNVAGSNYSFIGGGYLNQATGASVYGYNAVAGGRENIAAADNSFIGGGGYNQIIENGIYHIISGGVSNLINSTNWANSIGGGYGHAIGTAETASGAGYITIGGGRQNTVSNNYATVSGGRGNNISGGYATVGGGQDNTGSSDYSTIAGGRANTVSGSYATVPGGVFSNASHFGEMAQASGGFAAAGDAQTSVYVMRREYAMAAGTWHDLFLDGNGASQRLTIASGRTVTFDILVSGRTEAGESAGYTIRGLIENVGGVTALVSAPTVTVLGEDDATWNVQVLANDTLDALLLQVQGNGETIRWVARVQTAEVAWPEAVDSDSADQTVRASSRPETDRQLSAEDPPAFPPETVD